MEIPITYRVSNMRASEEHLIRAVCSLRLLLREIDRSYHILSLCLCVTPYFFLYLLSLERVCRATAYQRLSLLALTFRLSGPLSYCIRKL
jgi:hypothetical protein